MASESAQLLSLFATEVDNLDQELDRIANTLLSCGNSFKTIATQQAELLNAHQRLENSLKPLGQSQSNLLSKVENLQEDALTELSAAREAVDRTLQGLRLNLEQMIDASGGADIESMLQGVSSHLEVHARRLESVFEKHEKVLTSLSTKLGGTIQDLDKAFSDHLKDTQSKAGAASKSVGGIQKALESTEREIERLAKRAASLDLTKIDAMLMSISTQIKVLDSKSSKNARWIIVCFLVSASCLLAILLRTPWKLNLPYLPYVNQVIYQFLR